MKNFILILVVTFMFNVPLFAVYLPEQLVLLQDQVTSSISWMGDDGRFAWIADTGKSCEEIFYYDGMNTIQITDNCVDKEIIDFRDGEIFFLDESDGDTDIYLFKEGEIINLSNNDLHEEYYYVDSYEGKVCWMSGTDFNTTDNGSLSLFLNG